MGNTIYKASGHGRQVTRDASSVGMGSDDEDQMVSRDDSVRGWDDSNQGSQNATIVPGVKPHVPTNRDGGKLSKHELVLQSLQARLPELLDGLGTGVLTRATLMRVCRNILREVRNQHELLFRTGKSAWNGPGSLSRTGPPLDPLLKKSIEKCFTKYEGLNAPAHKDELIQDISDILYDELVFHNIVRKLESSYAKDVENLEGNGKFNHKMLKALLDSKEEDLRRLHDERRRRLAGENPVTVRHTRGNDALRETMISHTFDTDESISESGGDVRYENYSTNNMDGETDSMNDEEDEDNDYSDSDNLSSSNGRSLTRQNRNNNLERSPEAPLVAKRVLQGSSSLEDLHENGEGIVDDQGFIDIGTLPLPQEVDVLAPFVQRSIDNSSPTSKQKDSGVSPNAQKTNEGASENIQFPEKLKFDAIEKLNFDAQRRRDLQKRFEAEQQKQIIHDVTDSVSRLVQEPVLNPDEYAKASSAGQKKNVVAAKKKKKKSGRKKKHTH